MRPAGPGGPEPWPGGPGPGSGGPGWAPGPGVPDFFPVPGVFFGGCFDRICSVILLACLVSAVVGCYKTVLAGLDLLALLPSNGNTDALPAFPAV